MALVQEYFTLTEKYINEYGARTILLMQVGSFFECYAEDKGPQEGFVGSNIVDFCRICELNMAEKKSASRKTVMAGFSHYMIDKYLNKLQEAGYTTVVYTQDEQKANTTRSLEGIYSPGTHFSLDTTKVTNYVASIRLHVVDMSASSSVLKKVLQSNNIKTKIQTHTLPP